MAKRLLVKNVSKAASNEQLSQRLQEIGNVKSVRIATDNVTFQSKGFATVEMETEEEGMKVFSELNGSAFMGLDLQVDMDSKN